MSSNGIDHGRMNQGPIETREIKPRDPSDPQAMALHNGQWYSPEEAGELKQREIAIRYKRENREKWEQTRQGQLCIAFYRAFQAYKDYMQANPTAIFTPYGPRLEYEEHKLFEEALRLMEDDRRIREETARRNLEKAQRAARCQHIHMNGEQCGAPRVRGRKLCHMHERMEEAKTESFDKPESFDMGSMEDPDSIQAAIQRLQKAIIDGKLESKQVGLLAYTIQLAAWNVTRTSWMLKEEE
jgi:hypothetical protein